MSKFKVGDTVKAIRSGYGVGYNNKGKTTVITKINGKYGNDEGVKTRDLKNPNYNDWISADSFELVCGEWDE